LTRVVYKKKKVKQTTANTQLKNKIREGSPDGTRKTMDEKNGEKHTGGWT